MQAFRPEPGCECVVKVLVKKRHCRTNKAVMSLSIMRCRDSHAEAGQGRADREEA